MQLNIVYILAAALLTSVCAAPVPVPAKIAALDIEARSSVSIPPRLSSPLPALNASPGFRNLWRGSSRLPHVQLYLNCARPSGSLLPLLLPRLGIRSGLCLCLFPSSWHMQPPYMSILPHELYR
ncbi:hypothetical protein C8F01DRAFT_1258003 [Mycena amicta]|nr:hypothetical protein C8F01DRAFT_1258003 [Mycena amicta]